MGKVICAILGGGRGSRLFPLTKERCKPAVGLGGKYRLIDIPVSNCLNSGYGSIFVITQFNTESLHRHISRTYSFDALGGRFVEVLSAEQTTEVSDWYQGTADAVRRNLRHLRLHQASHVLILSGDHLYRMDYRRLVAFHDESEADITLVAQPVTAAQATSFGVLKTSPEGRVVAFAEKPREEAVLRDLALADPVGEDPVSGEPLGHLASLGIYVFRPSLLRDLLAASDEEDFGREVIPGAISRHKVVAFPFRGYWEDIGTISSFYRANLGLTDPAPRFDLFDPDWPIYTRARYLPPARVNGSTVRSSLVAEGSIVEASEIEGSIVGVRSVIRRDCVIRDSILMGNDNYRASAVPQAGRAGPSIPDELGVRASCRIEGAIIDKNCRVGESVLIRGRPGSGVNADEDAYHVRDGIVIVPRSQVLPPGTRIVV